MITKAAVVYMLFYSEFEWWGQTYKPSQEVRPDANLTECSA